MGNPEGFQKESWEKSLKKLLKKSKKNVLENPRKKFQKDFLKQEPGAKPHKKLLEGIPYGECLVKFKKIIVESWNKMRTDDGASGGISETTPGVMLEEEILKRTNFRRKFFKGFQNELVEDSQEELLKESKNTLRKDAVKDIPEKSSESKKKESSKEESHEKLCGAPDGFL